MNAPHDTCHMKSTAYFSGMLGSQNSNKKNQFCITVYILVGLVINLYPQHSFQHVITPKWNVLWDTPTIFN